MEWGRICFIGPQVSIDASPYLVVWCFGSLHVVFSPSFSLFGVGVFPFFPNCLHLLIFQVASGMRGASLRVPVSKVSQFLPHYIFDTPKVSQTGKHWSCERSTRARQIWRNLSSWRAQTTQPGHCLERGGELDNHPLSRTEGTCPILSGWLAFKSDWWQESRGSCLQSWVQQTQRPIHPGRGSGICIIWEIDSSHQMSCL